MKTPIRQSVPLKGRRVFVYALILCVLLMGVVGFLSYEDARPVDGPITWGFPLPVYVESSGFGGEVEAGVFWIGLVVDGVLTYLVSLGLVYGFLRLR